MKSDLIRVFQTLEHPCGYYAERDARNLVIDPLARGLPQVYGTALEKGFRRSGGHVYRPHCANCRACIASRVPVAEFEPDRSQRRCLKRNADLTYADEAGRRNLPDGVGYWTPENRDNYWPSLSAYKNYRGYHFAEDWSYVRLKDVRLSYTVPKDFLSRYGIGALTIYAAGRNLYTWTNWVGWDPEMNYASRGSSGDNLTYPVVRSISLGINLSL